MSEVTFQVGDTVRGLVPIQLQGYAKPCDIGYQYQVDSVDHAALTMVVSRNEVQGLHATATVPFASVEQAYQVYNGTYYSSRTSMEVIRVLEQARQSGQRIHLHKGYTETSLRDGEPESRIGEDWLEEWDVEGTVSRSMGPHKIPLLINSRRSMGGGGIGDDAIVKITTTTSPRHVLWQHPRYHVGTVTLHEIGENEMTHVKQGEPMVSMRSLGYTHGIKVGGESQANFKSEAAALRYVKKMGLVLAEPATV